MALSSTLRMRVAVAAWMVPLLVLLQCWITVQSHAEPGAGRVVVSVDPSADAEFEEGLDAEYDTENMFSLMQINSSLRQNALAPANKAEAPASLPPVFQMVYTKEVVQAPAAQVEMSTQVKCLVTVVIQYMASFMLVLLGKALAQLFDVDSPQLRTAMTRAKLYSSLLPMIGVLIITANTRAEQLTRQTVNPEVYGIPQWWSSIAMLVVVDAGIFAKVLHLIASGCTPTPESGEPNSLAYSFFSGCGCVATFVQFVAIGTVITGNLLMDQPFDLWLRGGPVGVSSAMVCTISLLIQYFLASSVLVAASTADDLSSQPRSGHSYLTKVAMSLANAQSMGAMICVVFAAARLRNLGLGSDVGAPAWAQAFFYICADGLLIHTVLAACVTCLEEASAAKQRLEQELDIRTGSTVQKTSHAVFVTLKALSLLVVFVGIAGSLFSVLFIKVPGGWDTSSGFSATLTCVAVLALQYFGVNFVHFVASSVEEALEREGQVKAPSPLVETLAVAKDYAGYCAILCVLFLGARLQAFQNADVQAAPQLWVQDCMYACMWASLLHLVLVLAMGVVGGYRPEAPVPGMIIEPTKHSASAVVVGACQAACIAFMYAGAIGVLSGIFRMSSDTVVA